MTIYWQASKRDGMFLIADVPQASKKECEKKAKEHFGTGYRIEPISEKEALRHPDVHA